MASMGGESKCEHPAAFFDMHDVENRQKATGGYATDGDDEDEDNHSTMSFVGDLAAELREEKDELIGRVSASLMQEVNFTARYRRKDMYKSDEYKNAKRIAFLVHAISLEDGEFVLKLALYVRRELYIRYTAALLVALCAYEPKCQPFLKCYMRHIICLPSDWLNIANIAMQRPHLSLALEVNNNDNGSRSTSTTSTVKEQRGGMGRSLPNALRRALVETFSMFDDHSLSKYNTERSVKKFCRKERFFEKEWGNSGGTRSVRPLTMKDYIRRLHISQPAYVVCCILGKRYPNTEEEFRERGLDEGGKRTFDPAFCGRRMRLPIAQVWEVQISLRGNKGEVWDDMVAKKQLPFMATLRNLRSIIYQGCSKTTHAAIIRRLISEEQVIASRQFPYQFLRAYEALENSPDDICKFSKKLNRRRRNNINDFFYDKEVVKMLKKRYMAALERSTEISMRRNITPIRGMSIVIIDTDTDLLKSLNGGRSKMEEAAMLAVGLKYACEHCVLLVALRDVYRVIDWDFRNTGNMLQHVKMIKKICYKAWGLDMSLSVIESKGNSEVFPYAYLDDLIERRMNIQSIVVMGSGHSCYSGKNDAPSLGDLPEYLRRIRRTCNEDLLFLSLRAFTETNEKAELRYCHKNDVLLTGFSDAVLRFVAERNSGGARRYIERVDEVYDVNRMTVCPGQMTEGELRALKRMALLERERCAHKDSCAAESLLGGEGGDFTDTQISSASGIAMMTSAPQRQLPTSPMLPPLPTLQSTTRKTPDALPLTPAGPVTPIRFLAPEKGFLSTYRECRFFISSTFIDMNSERNALVLEVFPRLRRWAAEERLFVNIVEVDLRWGITEDASSSDLSLSVCLNEVSRCSPFFIGVLGSRYGYCPPTLYHRVDEDVDAEDFTWLKQFPHENSARMSVTEMEMRHAIFTAARRTGRRAPRTMAFFVRDHSSLMGSLPAEDREAYAPDTPTTMQSISKLSGHLEAQGVPMIPYNATGMRPRSDGFFSASMNLTKKSALNVPLDMTDFSRKAFVALKSIVLQYCARPDDASESVKGLKDSGDQEQQQKIYRDGNVNRTEVRGTLYEEECMDQVNFTTTLLKKFVPPQGLMEKLSFFALTGRLPTDAPSPAVVDATSTGTFYSTADNKAANFNGSYGTSNHEKISNVLLLQGSEGNGLSSVSAAVASNLVHMENSGILVVYFACQASDGSLRRLVYYLVFSLVYRLRLQEDFCVHESDSVTTLLQLLSRVYSAARKKSNICIILDGMEKSSYAAEILSNLGWIVLSSNMLGIRFIVTTALSSPFATALKLRVPPALSITLPDLNMPERAELVRRHLASYGKRLQESFRVNELKILLRKQNANQASYLTYAITYLRLFSSFDTLRADIAKLPSTLLQLHTETYKKLEERFGVETCRTVLVSLYLSQNLSGLKEYNLYRLVSNVANASRLVALLTGTCLHVARKRVLISNASFEASIAARYIPSSSNVVDAYANMLAAELYFRPLLTDVSRYEIRDSIRIAMDSIKRGSLETCVFRPERYRPSQLLALLHFALRSKEYDAFATIASYVTFIEYLLVNATYLQRFMNVLLQASTANSLLSRQLQSIIDFMQGEYHVLMDRPKLLRQCIRNLPGCKKIFHGLDCDSGGNPNTDGMSDNAIGGSGKPCTWINWLNSSQHGEEGRTLAFPTTEPLLCVALSDDGKFMAVGGEDSMVRVVPIGALDQISASLKHMASVTAIAFFPTRSHILLTGCRRGILRVWSLEDNSLLQQGMIENTRCISSLACHPTKSIVCSGNHDGICAVWHVVSSAVESAVRPALRPIQLLNHHRAPVSCVTYHNLGEILATGSWEGLVYFINMERPMDAGESEKDNPLKYAHQVFDTHSPVRALAFLPSMVVTCAVALYNGEICLYDYASALCSARLTLHAGIPITSIAFSPDAKLMASANERGNVRITYAGVAGTVICTLNGHRQPVTSVAFHKQKPSTLFTSSADKSLKEWSFGQNDRQKRMEMRGTHVMIVTACAAASDGSFFVTGGMEGTAFVFAGREVVGAGAFYNTDGKEDFFAPHFVLAHERHRVSCIRIVMQNSRILCGTAAGEVFIWASSPGLNHREGRLLQRIRVVNKDAYPVVFIECNEVNVTGVDGDGRQVDNLSAANSHRSSCNWAMALTTNGMVAAWEIYDDDTATRSLKNQWVNETLSGKISAASDDDAETNTLQSTDANSEEVSHANSATSGVKSSSETTVSSRGSCETSALSNSQDAHGNHAGMKSSLKKSSSVHDTQDTSGQLTIQRASLRWVGQTDESPVRNELRQQTPTLSTEAVNSYIMSSNDAEEIIAAVSLVRNTQTNRLKVNSQNEAIEAHVAPPDAHHHAWLLCGRYIAVGRLRCHLLLPSLQRAILLPMQNPLQLDYFVSDGAPNGSIGNHMLKKGEFFLSASNSARVKNSWFESEDDNISTAVLFALGTSLGTVLILEAAYDAQENGPTSVEVEDPLDNLMLKEQQRTRLTLRHVTHILGNHGDRIPVDSITLTTIKEDSREPILQRDALTTLQVVVGCRDGSTRLFTVFPFREMADGYADSVDTSNGDANLNAEKGKEGEEEEEKEKELADARRRDLWNEEGIFFASSGITAVTVMRMPEKVSPTRSRVDKTLEDYNTLLTSAAPKFTASMSPSFRHIMYIAGDWLGNVYQLRLERDEGNKKTGGNMKPFTTLRWAPERNWMDGLHRSTAMGAEQHGWGWRSETLFSSHHEHNDEVALALNLQRVADWRREERRIASMFVSPQGNLTAALADDVSRADSKSSKLVPPHPILTSSSVAAATNSAENKAGVPPYELILEKMPAGLDPSQRREWLQRRQRLLVEALQAQRNAVKARAVLAEYSKDALLSLGVSLTM
ncbi:putative telomerase component [Trypanosoma cruzi]|uniref:Putative telomerase component n=1 Tax=Trypanosoma cruzi TaxID=5693 RepID=A0A2V2VVD5_TRYCR|nr:putative telomerase component [Trypanosoma cruzi]